MSQLERKEIYKSFEENDETLRVHMNFVLCGHIRPSFWRDDLNPTLSQWLSIHQMRVVFANYDMYLTCFPFNILCEKIKLDWYE